MSYDLDDIRRFFDKVDLSGSCWIWTSTTMKNRYGYFTVNKKLVRAHRFSYELFFGDIPKGLELDHLCRNRDCVNPQHLEAVTRQENLSRGQTGKINNSQSFKTHCPKGHEYSESNLAGYSATLGYRRCKICTREYARMYYHKTKP